ENGQLRDSSSKSNKNADDRQRMVAEYADKLSELEKRNKALEQENVKLRNAHNSITNANEAQRTKGDNEGLLGNRPTVDPIAKKHQELTRENEELTREKNDLTRDNEELTLSLGQALAGTDEQEQKNRFYQKQIKELMNSMDQLLKANKG